MQWIRTEEDIFRLVEGCTFLGVGGGGNPLEGIRVLREAIKEKGPLPVHEVEEIADDAVAVCGFLMGSTAPLTPEKEKQMGELGLTEKRFTKNIMNAALEWERYTGKRIDVIVALETGGSNLPVPMAIGHLMGKTVVDGDYAGRAVPEISQVSLITQAVDFCPAVSFDKYGNVCIIQQSLSLPLAERMGKYLSEVAFGSTALIGFPISGSQLKQLLVKGSVKRALEIGGILAQARAGEGQLAELLAPAGFKRVFEGVVSKKEWEDVEGYYSGIHTFSGGTGFTGKEFQLYFKNETHIAWQDGAYLASSPDLLVVVAADQVRPLRNEEIEVGQQVEIYAGSCSPILKADKLLAQLEPKHFGYDERYVSVT